MRTFPMYSIPENSSSFNRFNRGEKNWEDPFSLITECPDTNTYLKVNLKEKSFPFTRNNFYMTYSRLVLYSYFRVEKSCFVVKSDSASMAVPVVEIGYRQTGWAHPCFHHWNSIWHELATFRPRFLSKR